MFELIGVVVGLAVAAAVLLVIGCLVILPLLLLMSLLGLTVRIAAGTIGWLLGGLILIPLGVLLIPVVAVVGGLLLIKLAILAAPIALVALAVWALVTVSRRTPSSLPAAQASSSSPVSPANARRT